MALLNSKREYPTNLQEVSEVAKYCADYFKEKGYTVSVEDTPSGAFISLTQGGTFKAISGQKTGLNITLTLWPGKIEAAMEVGIFGKQAIPAVIATFAFWPILIPQIVGIVKQNALDKEAYRVIEKAILIYEKKTPNQVNSLFCTYCGKPIPADFTFCPSCGKKVEAPSVSVCPNCGYELPDDSAFCPKCGTRRN